MLMTATAPPFIFSQFSNKEFSTRFLFKGPLFSFSSYILRAPPPSVDSDLRFLKVELVIVSIFMSDRAIPVDFRDCVLV